jgi:geranylgeranyl diphosphate synthase type 3
MNLQSSEYSQNKGFAEDLTEGKFSFPVIHHIRTSADSQLLNILRQRTNDVALKKYAVDLLQKTDSFRYTRDFLANVERDARLEIAKLGGNVHLEAILDYLHVI